jgi:beta-lactamase regulating signal transducer with metallopeptidase domain/DNA gyrase inhibitor GyrI
MIDLLNGIAYPWWAWMGSMLWQVSLLVLIVTALDYLLRRWAWPQVRYALWILVLVKLILPPSWTLPSSLFSGWTPLAKMRIEERLATPYRIPPAGEILRKPPSIPAYAATPESPYQSTDFQASQRDAQPGTISESTPPGPKLHWKAIAFLVWIIGMGIFIALLASRIAGLRRWHRNQVDKKSIPVWYYELLVKTTKRLKLARLPAIVFSKDAKAPAVYGLFRPVLLLPASYLDSLSPEDAEHVLLHELAHLKRGDLWLHGLCLLLQIVYWFNPLLIWTRRQMKHVREICCDLTIANVLKEKTMQYRQTLLNTARELLTETAEPGMGLLGVFEDPFRLVARLRWLEKRSWQKRKLMAAAVVLVTVIMTATVLPMGSPARESGSAVSRQETKSMEAEKARIENLRLDVEIKTIPPLYAAVLPRIGGLDESEFALSRLKQLLNKAGIEPTGYPFGRFISDSEKVPLEEFVWEIGYPVPPGTEVEPPLEIIRVSELQVASATIEGILHTEQVWPDFVRAVSDFGFVPAGLPVFEIWKGEPDGKEFWWKTEMQIMAFDVDEGYPGMEISFKETEPFTAFVLPMNGSYSQLADAARLLKKTVAEKGIRTTGPPFGRYFTDGSKVLPSQYRWEIGYPVEEGTTADPPFVVRRIEGAKVASTTLPGPPEPDYPWGPFILQILIEGYVPALPAMEIWHGDPEKSGLEGPMMELQIPVIDSEEIGD